MEKTVDQSPFIGYAYVALAALLWAISATVSKSLFRGGMTPYQLVQLRTTIASVVLSAAVFGRGRGLFQGIRRDPGSLLLAGLALAVTQFTYLYAISKIQVAAAILLQYQAPVFVALWALVFNRRRLPPSTIPAVCLAVGGCYLMVGAYRIEILAMNERGVISGIVSAVTFALYTLKSESAMREHGQTTVVWAAFVVAAFCWNVIQPPFGAFAAGYSPRTWVLIMIVGVFGTVAPFAFYTRGIGIIGAPHASITATLEPLSAGAIAYVFLGETMGPVQLVGAGLVVVSFLLLPIGRLLAGRRG